MAPKTNDAPAPAAVEAQDVDPKKILVHPRNPRRSAVADDELLASVRSQGVLLPLLLAPIPDDLDVGRRRSQEFVLIAGHRRLDAAVRAKLEKVPVVIRRDLDSLVAQLEAMVTENTAREDLSLLEEGDAYLELQGLGLSQARIHSDTGIRKDRISQRSRVARLPESARSKVEKGQVTLDAALTLAKVADDPELVTKIAARPIWDWDRLVTKEVTARTAAKAIEKARAELVAAGVRVLDGFPPGRDVDDAPHWEPLEVLLDLAWDTIVPPVAAEQGLVLDEIGGCDELTFEHVLAWHQARCGGHAVVERSSPGTDFTPPHSDWIPICTTPGSHGVAPADDAADEGEGADEGDAADGRPGAPHVPHDRPSTSKADEEAKRNALAAATEHRRAWLRDLLADTNRASGAVWRIFRAAVSPKRVGHNHELAMIAQPSPNPRTVAAMLQVLDGLDVPEGAATTSTAMEVVAAWADHSPHASPAPRLAIASIIAGHAPREVYLEDTLVEFKDEYGYCVPWVRALDAMGYPWTEQELEWLGRTQDPEEDAVASDGEPTDAEGGVA